jgi:hypothetical protein
MGSEQKYIDDLVRHTEESIRFFSNEMKSERERSVCAAFLRCLGIDFSPGDILTNKNDPPDVIYKSARFEVVELYDKRRKRLDEYKNRLKELKTAKSMDDTLIRVESAKPISYSDLFDEISRALSKKALKYGERVCSGLDALVYVSLPNRFLRIESSIPDLKDFISQGWRSISFLIPPWSHVIWSIKEAPQFLSFLASETKSEWKEPDGFFDL